MANRKRHFDSLIETYAIQNPNKLTVQIIRDILDNKSITRKDKGYDFAQFVIEHINQEYKKNKQGWSRTKNGISNMNVFQQFLQSKHNKNTIYLGDITPQLINEYIDFRREIKHNTDATINHALTPIIKACKHAAAQGLMDVGIANLIEDCRVITKEDYNLHVENFDGKYLSKEQLRKLLEYCDDNRCHTHIQRDYIHIFLFAFYACGMRLSDVITLKWKHINPKSKTIQKTQIKTKKRNTIPLINGAEEILEKWNKTHTKTEYVFGFIPDNFNLNDSETLYKIRNNTTRKINQSLSAVGKNLEFTHRLTFHMARHSFAMYALNDEKIPMGQVSQLLGHTCTEVTEKMYASYLPEALAEGLAKICIDVPTPK